MYVREKKTPHSEKTAIQLVESLRKGGRVQQKVIRHFGYALNDSEKQALKRLALQHKAELENRGQLSLVDDTSTLEKVLQNKSDDGESPLPVNLRDLKEEQRLQVGIHQSYGVVFHQLGYGTVIKNPARRKAAVKYLFHMVMARISKPVSKRSSVNMLEHEYGVSLNLDAVYRMMDYVDESAIERVKQLSYQYVKGIFDEALNVIFYDCTTLYFESFTEDELKQNGYSKDGKFNQSQVLLAVLVTQSGMPIGYELFEGGRFEGHTLLQALNRLYEHYQIQKVIFVADAAMLSGDNIKEFHRRKQEFIVGARIKNLPAAITEQVLDKSRYQPLTEDEEPDITYQEIWLEKENLRLIVTYSQRRARKDRHDREKAIEALTRRLQKSSHPKELLSNFGYKKFVSLDGNARVVVNEEKIRAAEQWDGLHGIITNIPAHIESASSVLAHYKGLWQVEETFRISKHDLRMRPIFHWIPRRIKAHIAICFMALMCIRVLEYRVRLQYKKMSPAAIRNALLQLQVSILKDHKTGYQYVMPSKASQDAKKILQIMGKKWTDTPYRIN